MRKIKKGLADVETFLTSFNPAGKLNPEEGFIFGSSQTPLLGILVTWMASVDAIQHAITNGCNLIICHEALTFFDYFIRADQKAGLPWSVDVKRMNLLYENNISVLRVHSTVDPTHVVPELVRAIGLNKPIKQGAVWSLHHCAGTTVADVAIKAKKGLGMQQLRVTGNPKQKIERIGTMVGGLGLDRHIDAWVNNLLPLGVELIVAGETNDFAQRFALDADIALIETCHSASEDPGLCKLSNDITQEFNNLPVIFHPQVIPWSNL